ncbi:MAG TPA: hypothetical protein VLB44_06095, partial [Kofleriaceae bacterium]|nr:hypothetical protein [Kofleriaceae bacterium]
RDNPPGELMFQRSVVGNLVKFSLVIDLITIEDRFPGCRGEELVQECVKTGACKIYTAQGRYCQDITVPLSELSNPAAIIQNIGAALRMQGPIIADDPPDVPTVIRAVASLQTCAEIAASPSYPLLDVDSALGCAYSCPALLDQVEGTISLSLDSLTQNCEQLVRACAGFPRVP